LAVNRLEARTFRIKGLFATVAALSVVGCQHEATTLPLSESRRITFAATNYLIAPVTIAVDGSPYAIVSAGNTTQMTLPASTRLTWTSAKPANAQGERIPDEIGEQQVDVAGISGALEITNLIGKQTYFTARIFNFTNTRVSIGVYDGEKVWCAAALPAQSATAPGFTLIGYYRLLSQTELRAYTTSLACTGAYASWPSSELAGMEPKSGLLTLSLEPAS
jgi:hypothetical protein